MRQCNIKDCSKEVHARGLCNNHYGQLLRKNDPKHYRSKDRYYRTKDREKYLNRVHRANRSHNKRYTTSVFSAKRRGLEFSISKEEYLKLLKENCAYCGAFPDNSAQGVGLDRIDSSLGYTKENSVTCCKKCNLAKHVMSVSEFEAHIIKIYENFQRKASQPK